MSVEDLASSLGLERLAGAAGCDASIEGACVCDLLSWVLAFGEPRSAWITVQASLSVVAVAVERGIACVIVAAGVEVPDAVAQRAELEGLPLYTSPLAAYELCCELRGQGV